MMESTNRFHDGAPPSSAIGGKKWQFHFIRDRQWLQEGHRAFRVNAHLQCAQNPSRWPSRPRRRTTTPAAAPSAEAQGWVFSVIAVVGKDKVSVLQNGDKLAVVIRRRPFSATPARDAACTVWPHREQGHPFYGLTSCIRTVLRAGLVRAAVRGFVSSIIEQGSNPSKMGEVRGRFKELGLESYDCEPAAHGCHCNAH